MKRVWRKTKDLPRTGIEPVTFRSSVWRSPNWAIAAFMHTLTFIHSRSLFCYTLHTNSVLYIKTRTLSSHLICVALRPLHYLFYADFACNVSCVLQYRIPPTVGLTSGYSYSGTLFQWICVFMYHHNDILSHLKHTHGDLLDKTFIYLVIKHSL